MKVVQFMASQGWGGAEKVLVDLSNELAEGMEVVALLLRDTEYRNRFSPKVTIVELNANPTRYNPLLSLEIYRKLRTLRPDIIHTHAVKASELVAGINRFLGIPHLGTKHNNRKGKIFNRLPRVTAVSSCVAASVIPRAGAQLTVIPNGITPVRPVPKRLSDHFSILAVGRLDPIKGFDVLIRQCAQLTFPYRLTIVGEGPQRRELAGLIADLQVTGTITLLGGRDDIPDLMAGADLLVVSSQKEGFGNVLLEGLLYAPVVISTPVGIAPELLPKRLLCGQENLAGAIAGVRQESEIYRALLTRSKQEKAQGYLMSNVTAAYTACYRNIVFP